MTAISIAPGRVRTVAASASGRPGNALNSAGSSAAVQTSAPFRPTAPDGAAAGRVSTKAIAPMRPSATRPPPRINGRGSLRPGPAAGAGTAAAGGPDVTPAAGATTKGAGDERAGAWPRTATSSAWTSSVAVG